MIDIVTIETPGLGDRSYALTDGSVAVVVDPQRDIDRVQQVLEERGVALTHVLETHIHNDYVSGGLALARLTGAEYVVAADEPVAFERTGVREGEELTTGRMLVRPLHTPGHTPHHLSFVVAEQVADEVVDRVVLTGGSLLYGTVGRTDLIDPARTHELTRAQYRSTRRLLGELRGDVLVLPTHGFGSFCSSAQPTERSDGTVAGERAANEVARTDDEDAFVSRLMAGLTAYPSYYQRMAPINRGGPAPADLSPLADLDPEDVRRRIAAGEWVVDLRERRAYAESHLVGTVNVGLNGAFATYLGWVLPWPTAVTLLADHASEVTAAHRELVRIGVDSLAGRVVGGPAAVAAKDELRSYRVADFPALAKARDTEGYGKNPVVLDVRRADEWVDGHIDGAVHIPLADLLTRIDEVPRGPLWVHCAAGFRASIGASLLAGQGRDVVLIDDEFANAPAAGLPLA